MLDLYSSKNAEKKLDTEDWSNDAKNPALHHRNKFFFYIYIYIQIENIYIKF